MSFVYCFSFNLYITKHFRMPYQLLQYIGGLDAINLFWSTTDIFSKNHES